ncbi:DUF4062 domain-containing protein [Sphingomonas endolithica]|uniref:DUF4062 domain-containing protein n=1 Tax=Sphingomonas endolithica TaxID=2972485 RepID=UPI0021AF93F4|nr:DUF4062 domain-containing protein [Sphingomonas sp. ZFBP2030]
MADVDKRYQVFVSSTFRDLIEERKEVMQALLELDCIPSGMELFQAADEDQWTLIKRVIDDCDYYMVIVAGRYGSIGSGGLSYTEMEYRYATEQGKPVVSFLHEAPSSLTAEHTELEPEGREKLAAFRKLCEMKMVKYWNGPSALGSVVSRSIIKVIKDRPAVGWIRGSAVTSDEANREILRLRQLIDKLEAKVRGSATSRPEGAEALLQDGDMIPTEAIVKVVSLKNAYQTQSIFADAQVAWDDIWNKISPRLIEEISESDLEDAVDEVFSHVLWSTTTKNDTFKDRKIKSITSSKDAFHKIKVQLVALGLIMRGDKKRTVSDAQNYWKLTPYGETKMMSALAMRRAAKNSAQT